MRFCFWSLLLACLVLLASPLQGAAHAADTAMVDCHGQMVAAAAETAADAHHIAKADKCNLCSPCCAGALVNTVQLPGMAAAPAISTFPEPSAANPAPLLAGLDRPPRPLAA